MSEKTKVRMKTRAKTAKVFLRGTNPYSSNMMAAVNVIGSKGVHF